MFMESQNQLGWKKLLLRVLMWPLRSPCELVNRSSLEVIYIWMFYVHQKISLK